MRIAAAPEDVRLVEQLEEVWHRIAELGSTLSEDEWKRPTEVPGWSVQDNLTHLTDVESMLLGRPRPEHVPPEGLLHVKNEIGARNEAFVDARRAWAGADALAEFVEVTEARLAHLRRLPPEGFAASSWTPMGPGTVRDLLPFRVFDSWVHEQDMRRGVGRPGGLVGLAATASMERIVGTAPYVVGKKVGAPDGTVVVVVLTGPLARTFAVGVEGGRARPLGTVPGDPTVRLTLDGEIYARLACGRADPAATLAEGSVGFDGDEVIGRRIVEELNFLF